MNNIWQLNYINDTYSVQLIDDLNVMDVNDRDVLLQSVAAFTGNDKDCITNDSLNQSSLITSFADNADHENTSYEATQIPEMEVLKTTEDNCEKKTTNFPAYTELLPTIGEEDEINEGGKILSTESLQAISLVKSTNDEIETQVVKSEKNDEGK